MGDRVGLAVWHSFDALGGSQYVESSAAAGRLLPRESASSEMRERKKGPQIRSDLEARLCMGCSELPVPVGSF